MLDLAAFSGKYYVYYHRYHLVWPTKYRYKVLRGDIKLRVRDICRQVCTQNGVDIIRGVLSSDHVHMFVSVPPKLAISDLMRLMKGRSRHKMQREFLHLKKRYWGRNFCGRGWFSTTNGALTEDIDFSTRTGVVLLFRRACSPVKVDQGFISAASLSVLNFVSSASHGVNIPWIECGRSEV